MPKAILVYISREGCGYCNLFDREWPSIKNSNPDVIYRQYKVPQTKIPQPLSPYEKWYPLLVLVPYMSYLRSMSISDDGNDIVSNAQEIADGKVFNGIVTKVGGKLTVEYSNPTKQMATADTVNSWVSQMLAGMADVGGPMNYSSPSASASALASSSSPVASSRTTTYLPTAGSRYRSAWE